MIYEKMIKQYEASHLYAMSASTFLGSNRQAFAKAPDAII